MAPNPNLADDKGRAPLYAAVDMRNLEWSTRPAPPEKDTLSELDLIKALLDHGASPNARLTKKIPLRGQPSFDGRWANQIGATPFWRAAQSDDVTVMKLLVDHGADPLIADQGSHHAADGRSGRGLVRRAEPRLTGRRP